MKGVGISTFKVKCLGILADVYKTQKAVRVIRSGIPVAEIAPPSTMKSQIAELAGEWLGCMKGTARITGDIVAPLVDD
jgi:hypothetical protein